jgi:ATP-dependent exoDNAse (exonuclease V) alpha subunit
MTSWVTRYGRKTKPSLKAREAAANQAVFEEYSEHRENTAENTTESSVSSDKSWVIASNMGSKTSEIKHELEKAHLLLKHELDMQDLEQYESLETEKLRKETEQLRKIARQKKIKTLETEIKLKRLQISGSHV